ncbi:MAG: DNA alkylation repair protein [Candidatus Paceibacterota bacterium]|jgi:3-methyladenine DNA glycosylase AlkD
MKIRLLPKSVKNRLKQVADPEKVVLLSRFFKTGKGEYGEGDKFLGIVVPVQRSIARKYVELDLKQIGELLRDKYHEVRLTGFLILVYKVESLAKVSKSIVDLYLSNLDYVNNWDLVDLTAPRILGKYLFDEGKSRKILYKLAKSKDIWRRRIAIISTLYFISKNDFQDTVALSEILMKDQHDLIHKAVGWMLREVGKRDEKTLISFLRKYAQKMPRIMFRYSIERLKKDKLEMIVS